MKTCSICRSRCSTCTPWGTGDALPPPTCLPLVLKPKKEQSGWFLLRSNPGRQIFSPATCLSDHVLDFCFFHSPISFFSVGKDTCCGPRESVCPFTSRNRQIKAILLFFFFFFCRFQGQSGQHHRHMFPKERKVRQRDERSLRSFREPQTEQTCRTHRWAPFFCFCFHAIQDKENTFSCKKGEICHAFFSVSAKYVDSKLRAGNKVRHFFSHELIASAPWGIGTVSSEDSPFILEVKISLLRASTLKWLKSKNEVNLD